MHVVHTITTTWAPYSLIFSLDGTRLAIGGGSWYGRGGFLIFHLTSQETTPKASTSPHNPRQSPRPTCHAVHESPSAVILADATLRA
jgi:hypothetical protein